MKLDTKSPAYVILFAAVVSGVFVAAISALQVATAERVRLNEALREKKALVRLFGLGDATRMSDRQIVETVARRVDETQLRDPQTGETFRLIRAYATDAAEGVPRRDDDLLAVAIPCEGSGFWARIEALLALSPDCRTVRGMVILDQSETPGLGGRITEREFLGQFDPAVRRQAGRPVLRATPPDAGGKYVYVGAGTPSSPKDPRYGRDVDAITGATQTSIRMQEIINDSLARLWRALDAAGAARQPAPE